MRSRTTSLLAWTLAAAALGTLLLSVGLKIAFGLNLTEDISLVVPTILGAAAMCTVGALIASRTRNALGWLLIAIPLATGIAALGEPLAEHGARTGAGYAAVANWLQTWPFLGSLTLLIAVFYLYPTGRIPSPRWRWPWRIYVTAGLVTVVGFAVLPTSERVAGRLLQNPFAIDPLAVPLGAILAFAGITVALSAFASFASMWARYRGAGSEERQQLRWLFLVGAVGVILLVVLVAIGVAFDEPTSGPAATIADVVLFFLVTVVVVGMPVAVGIAILRYHLYDIDVVIKKTVTLAVLALFITAVYLAIVVVAGNAITKRSTAPLAFLVGGLAGAALPVVRRFARRVGDRFVYGKRATPYEVLTEFSAHASQGYAVEEILPLMAKVLAEGSGAKRTTVLLDIGGEVRPVATWPQGERVADGHRFDVRHQGESLGALAVEMPPDDPMNHEKEKLIEDLASQAGLVLRNVRLIEELRASRQRLVTAQDEERRKLERNLHDGAQQQLVALQVQLRLARQLVDSDSGKAGQLLDGIQVQATDALDDLRDLARGIYPPLLADKGLAAALEAQARKSAMPVQVEADGIARYPQEAEAAVYFCCLEALQNIAKYANASRATVKLEDTSGELSFRVEDDGAGFDPKAAKRGAGVTNMSDRLAALDGELELRSAPGEGTTVAGRIPIPASERAR